MQHTIDFNDAVEQISLTFELDEETLVHSEMKLKRSKSQSTSELRLNGDKDSKVIRVQLNDRVLSAEEYQIERTEDQTYLVISDSVFASEKEPFTLRISNAIYPSKNKTYSGLYNSDDIFCTQCEAEVSDLQEKRLILNFCFFFCSGVSQNYIFL